GVGGELRASQRLGQLLEIPISGTGNANPAILRAVQAIERAESRLVVVELEAGDYCAVRILDELRVHEEGGGELGALDVLALAGPVAMVERHQDPAGAEQRVELVGVAQLALRRVAFPGGLVEQAGEAGL